MLAFASDGNAHDRHYFAQPPAMIAGAVAPPRLDLANQELIEAHIHSSWLAAAGPTLHQSIAMVLDVQAPDLPLMPDVAAASALSQSQLERLEVAATRIVDACGPEVQNAPWLTADWVRDTVLGSTAAFDQARSLPCGPCATGSGSP